MPNVSGKDFFRSDSGTLRRPLRTPDLVLTFPTSRGLRLFRVDSRACFAVVLFAAVEGKRPSRALGAVTISGIPVLGCGIIGPPGAVIVDSTTAPTRVIGAVDGMGGIIRPKEELLYGESIKRVRDHLLTKMYEIGN